jgi:hypothetical protein
MGDRDCATNCHKEVATDEVREASRARAPDSPMPGEYIDARTARPDEELQMRMANAFCRYLEMAETVGTVVQQGSVAEITIVCSDFQSL